MARRLPYPARPGIQHFPTFLPLPDICGVRYCFRSSQWLLPTPFPPVIFMTFSTILSSPEVPRPRRSALPSPDALLQCLLQWSVLPEPLPGMIAACPTGPLSHNQHTVVTGHVCTQESLICGSESTGDHGSVFVGQKFRAGGYRCSHLLPCTLPMRRPLCHP